MNFIFRDADKYTNEPSTNYFIDFGNGSGWQQIAFNVNYNVSYSDTGWKELKMKAVLSNSTELLSHCLIHINQITGGAAARLFENANVNFQATTLHSGGRVQIRYGQGHGNNIIKPFIIVEDLDPYKDEDPRNTILDNFYMNLYANNYGSNLKNLINSEYDIIYIDYRNGSDDIKRNAALFKEVIQFVNNQKALSGSTQQNVVLGIGMGGLVARWGLRKIETEGAFNHQTRLFIENDVPNQGIYIPMGLQALTRDLDESPVGLGYGYLPSLITGPVSHELKLLNKMAIKQMAIYYQKYGQPGMDNTIHDQFQIELKALGYPQNCRNIAISNGSECASTNGLQPGQVMLYYSGRFSTRIIADLVGTFNPFQWLRGIADLIFYQNAINFLTALPGKNTLNYDLTVRALPSTGSIRVYEGKIWYRKKLLWFIGCDVDLSNYRFYANPGNLIPFESLPGGQSDFNNLATYIRNSSSGNYNSGTSFWQEMSNFFTNLWQKRGVNQLSIAFPGTSCYVPTTSALDIGEGNAVLTTADYLKRYDPINPPITPKQTPFANFITEFNSGRINSVHGSLSARTGNWIASELNLSPQIITCKAFCDVLISGADRICNNPEVYSVPVTLDPNTMVSWSVDNTSIVSPFTNGNQVTLTPRGSGTITLSANITTPCGSFTRTKTISVGGGISITSSSNYCNGTYQTWSLSANPSSNGSNWQWTVDYLSPGSDIYIDNPNSSFTYVNVSGNGVVKLSYTDFCGANRTDGVTVYSNCENGYAYTLSPNPATSTVTISSKETIVKGAKTEKTIKEITILDQLGNIKKRQQFGKVKTATLNISTFPVGIYFIEIGDGVYKERQQLIIQR